MTKQPLSLSVDLAQTATFICCATGHNICYQWTAVSGSFPKKVTNATTHTLVIPDVRSSDSDIYTCTISNDNGSIMSIPAQLIVSGMTWISYALNCHFPIMYRSASCEDTAIISACRG